MAGEENNADDVADLPSTHQTSTARRSQNASQISSLHSRLSVRQYIMVDGLRRGERNERIGGKVAFSDCRGRIWDFGA
jgi:hypothetical protein